MFQQRTAVLSYIISICCSNIDCHGALNQYKTTTMRMLSTLLAPTTGEIRYDDLTTIGNEHEIKKRIGFLTNEIRLVVSLPPISPLTIMVSSTV